MYRAHYKLEFPIERSSVRDTARQTAAFPQRELKIYKRYYTPWLLLSIFLRKVFLSVHREKYPRLEKNQE